MANTEPGSGHTPETYPLNLSGFSPETLPPKPTHAAAIEMVQTWMKGPENPQDYPNHVLDVRRTVALTFGLDPKSNHPNDIVAINLIMQDLHAVLHIPPDINILNLSSRLQRGYVSALQLAFGTETLALLTDHAFEQENQAAEALVAADKATDEAIDAQKAAANAIQEREEQEQKARIDQRTGLATEEAQLIWLQTEVFETGNAAYVIYGDMLNLKFFNDFVDHRLGDELIRESGSKMQAIAMRESDNTSSTARINKAGDEFRILVADDSNEDVKDDVEGMVDRFRSEQEAIDNTVAIEHIRRLHEIRQTHPLTPGEKLWKDREVKDPNTGEVIEILEFLEIKNTLTGEYEKVGRFSDLAIVGIGSSLMPIRNVEELETCTGLAEADMLRHKEEKLYGKNGGQHR